MLMWTGLYISKYDFIYFDTFGVESVSKEVKMVIRNKTQKQTYAEYKQIIQ